MLGSLWGQAFELIACLHKGSEAIECKLPRGCFNGLGDLYTAHKAEHTVLQLHFAVTQHSTGLVLTLPELAASMATMRPQSVPKSRYIMPFAAARMFGVSFSGQPTPPESGHFQSLDTISKAPLAEGSTDTTEPLPENCTHHHSSEGCQDGVHVTTHPRSWEWMWWLTREGQYDVVTRTVGDPATAAPTAATPSTRAHSAATCIAFIIAIRLVGWKEKQRAWQRRFGCGLCDVGLITSAVQVV